LQEIAKRPYYQKIISTT